MCLEKLPPFPRMIVSALGGTVVGIAFGLGFGLVIAFVTMQFGNGQIVSDVPFRSYEFPAFLGMGFGAIVGAVLGGTHANRK